MRSFWSWKRQRLKRPRRSRGRRSRPLSAKLQSGVPDRVRGHASPPRRVPDRVGATRGRRRAQGDHLLRPPRRVLRHPHGRLLRVDRVQVRGVHRPVDRAGGRSPSRNPRRSPGRAPRPDRLLNPNHSRRLVRRRNRSRSPRADRVHGPSRSRARSRVRVRSRRVALPQRRPSLRVRNPRGCVRARRVPRVWRRAQRRIG